MFDKLKALLIWLGFTAAIGGASSVAGADWLRILTDLASAIPGGEVLVPLMALAVVQGLDALVVWLKRERSGYGFGVPTSAPEDIRKVDA